MAKGDTFGTMTGLISSMSSTAEPEPESPKKTKAQIMEDLRKALAH
tara:strand:+ start:153 stop:290 length:138 start_codon:yes stop_codon:yes gene_type:complete